MKKILTLFLCLTLLVCSCNSIFASNKEKVTFSVWTENNIYAGLNETITLASKLDKANLAYILSEAFNLDNVSTIDIKIKDVKNTHWAYQYICNVIGNDIMPLYDGYFFPDDFIEREEIAQYFQFLDLSYPPIDNLEFSDLNKVTEEYKDMFLKFVAAGYIKPISNVYLRPERNLSITETINILNLMFPNVSEGIIKDEIYDGHFLMKNYVNYLGNIDISGDLIISEGVILNNAHLDNNLVTLENLNIEGNIYIYGGTTYGEYVLKNVKCENIIIITENPVIMSLDKVTVKNIENHSKLSNFITNQKLNIIRK